MSSTGTCEGESRSPEPEYKSERFSWEDVHRYLYGRTRPVRYSAAQEAGDDSSKYSNSPDDVDRKSPSLRGPAFSFPDEVKLCKSGIPNAGLGVSAARPIPPGTWIGPYEGQVIRQEDLEDCKDTSYMWEIFKEGKFSHYIDGKDESLSSWMRFIQCARYREEQNMTVFQYCGNIYYRAFKHIPVGTELLVWYDEKYSEFIDIPALMRQGHAKDRWRAGLPRSPRVDNEMLFPDSVDNRHELRSQADLFAMSLTDTAEANVWKCGQCSLTFTQRVLLQMHVCSKEPNKPYQCGHCPASFQEATELREHVVVHMNEKPFKCGYCGRSFSGATTLNNHIRTHTGEKPFKCTKCGKNFTQSTQLSRHQKALDECKGSAA